MQQTFDTPARKFGWGVPASLAVHLAVVALLIFGLPMPQFEPQPPETIAVELVPEPQPPEPEPEEPEEPEPEEPPPAADAPPEQAAAQPMQALRPVFEFGDEDTGPEISEDGNAAAEAENPADEPALLPDERIAGAALVPEPQPPVELAEARTLFSHAISGDAAAMTAMGALTRGERASELCATELREQLRHATPPYRPSLLPAYRLDTGDVLDVRRGAFRAGAEWFDLRFRCQVDADATRVLSFAFAVGAPVPRSEWQRRGFPEG